MLGSRKTSEDLRDEGDMGNGSSSGCGKMGWVQSVYSAWSPQDLLMDVGCGGEVRGSIPRTLVRTGEVEICRVERDWRGLREFSLGPEHSRC